jgi:TolB-like protein/Tfp pilus assembly protein PilF
MPVAAAKSSTCKKCGAEIDTTTSADLGCIVCLLDLGFDRAVECDSSLDEFGHYVIEKREDGRAWELGRGAMGVTYLATDSVLQRHVALKIINLARSRNVTVARERFLDEARAAAALRHRNIATVYHFGIREESGQCFYAMELVEGETLEQRVRRIGPCDVRTTIQVAHQVADALAAAEKRGLVHRDIKPANLMMLDRDGDNDFAVKVIDFGIAKTVAETGDTGASTHTGLIGTPAFASPEQWSNGEVDARSDIYSLGATLWYLLTGQPPFRDNQHGSPPIEQLKAAKVPSRLITLLCAMLASEPTARPGVRDLAAKLQRLQSGNVKKATRAAALAIAAALLVTVTLALFRHETAVDQRLPEKSIAVLPFENRSEDKGNAYFADGIQDEILTDLAKIADLKVISRTSVMQYKSNAPRNLREIGQQLGVAHLVEGSVQRVANRVRVNAQLLDARNDAHLWAQTYDRDLADVFAIQSEIAKAIADQLQAKLSPNEKKIIEQPPTIDLAAFDLYSRAKSLLLTAAFSARRDEDRRKAIELLDAAVNRDPSFFDAYCQLAYAHEAVYAISGFGHTAARLSLAEAALQAAARLRPDAAETHLARAQYLYFGPRDYGGALAEVQIARRALPNDPRLFELTGFILRGRGQSEEALQNLQRAVELDPRNIYTLQQIAGTYRFLGRYAEAIAAFNRASAIVPDSAEMQGTRAETEFFWKAAIRPLRQTIDAILAQEPGSIARVADSWFLSALAERNPTAAERALIALGDNPCWAETPIVLSHSFGEGLVARMVNDEARARTAFEAARAQQEKIVQAQPDYGPTLCVLGLIDAALGRKDLALDEGRRAIALTPLEKGVISGSLVLQYFAITAAWAGDKELAVQQLEAGLHAPAAALMLSYGGLKLHPLWDPLRGDPRFEKIVASLAPNARVESARQLDRAR